MKNYKVIQHQTPPEFHKLVEQALENGWQLVGGVSTITVPLAEEGRYQVIFFQAVAK